MSGDSNYTSDMDLHPIERYAFEKGLSLRALSRLAGLSQGTLGHIVNGRSEPSKRTAVLVEKATKGGLKLLEE